MKNHLVPVLCLITLLQITLSAQENVGVGTVTPGSRLDVQGNNTTTTVINSMVNYSGASDVIAMKGTSLPAIGRGIGGQYVGGYIGLDGNANGTSSTGSSYGVYGHSTGTAGTRYGVYGLASGAATNYGVVGFADGGLGYYGVYGYNGNAAGYAGFFSGRGRFTMDLFADQDVGIGTTTPVTRLHIPTGSDASLTTNGFIVTGVTTGWNLVMDDNEIMARNNGAGNDLLFQQDAGNILMCGLEQGRVGIGVQLASNLPAGYMLAVDGKIIGEELRIQNSANWPDYVFTDHYELMPLEKLRESIEANNHLPNIPSAEVVEQEGILVGDMQKRMMEKIEELTLYVLDLNETNKKQQAEIDELTLRLRSVTGEK